MSDEEVKVVTKAEIPTKIFYYVNETLEVKEIVPEGILPDSLDNNHENKYYYNDAKNKLYLVGGPKLVGQKFSFFSPHNNLYEFFSIILSFFYLELATVFIPF